MEHMYDSVKLFENTIAEYAGSKYAIAVDSGTNAIFLCCKYLKVQEVTIPSQSFCSIAAATLHAGGDLKFRDYEWSGRFQLEPYPIWDSAGRFHRGMYIDDSHYCLSFHANKHLKIGKGGMILTNDKNAAKWFNLARYYGMQDAYSDEPGKIVMAGWNMIMTPDMASRGYRRSASQLAASPMASRQKACTSSFIRDPAADCMHLRHTVPVPPWCDRHRPHRPGPVHNHVPPAWPDRP